MNLQLREISIKQILQNEKNKNKKQNSKTKDFILCTIICTCALILKFSNFDSAEFLSS